MSRPYLEEAEDFNQYGDFLIDLAPSILQSYITNDALQYRKCKISLCGYNEAICEPLDLKSKADISIAGRRNCGMCFTGDIVIVKTIDKIAKVIGVLKPAFNERNPVFICRIDVNYANRNNKGNQKYDRVMPICGSLPSIRLRNSLDIPIEMQDFVVIKVKFLKWKSNSLIPLGDEIPNTREQIQNCIQAFIDSRVLDSNDSLRELPGLQQQLQQTLITKIKKRQKAKGRIFTNAITIDTDGCRVFDSAFSVTPKRLKDVDESSGIRVCVHVSDVSAFIKKNDRLDIQASERIMSYSDNRRHMLDEAVETICSLNSTENRGCQARIEANKLTLTFSFNVSPDGISNFEVFKSAISVRRNYFYSEVQKMFRDEKNPDRQVSNTIGVLHQAAKWLREDRLPEAHLFRDGKVKYHYPELIVSEITIAMNKLAAGYLLEQSEIVPSIPLRTQALPELEHIRWWLQKNPTLLHDYLYFKTYLLNLDEYVNEDAITKIVNTGIKETSDQILQSSTIRVNADVVRQLKKENFGAHLGREIIENEKSLPLLRAGRYDWFRIMQPAKYSAHDDDDDDNNIHFQLHLLPYVQVSAPIRRYLDIVVHRLIKYVMKQKNQVLDGKDTAKQKNKNINGFYIAHNPENSNSAPYEKQEIVDICEKINCSKETIKHHKRLIKWTEELKDSYKGWVECVILSVSESGLVVFTNPANPSGTTIEYKHLNLYNNPKLKRRRNERSPDSVHSLSPSRRALPNSYKSNQTKSLLESLTEHYKAIISWQGRLYDTRQSNTPNARPSARREETQNDTQEKEESTAENDDDDDDDADEYNSDDDYVTVSGSSDGFTTADEDDMEQMLKSLEEHPILQQQESGSASKNNEQSNPDEDSEPADASQMAEDNCPIEDYEIPENNARPNHPNAGTKVQYNHDLVENTVQTYSLDPRSKIYKANVTDWIALQDSVLYEHSDEMIEFHLRKVFEASADPSDYISGGRKRLVNTVTSEMNRNCTWNSHQVRFNIDVKPGTVLRAQLGDPIIFKYPLSKMELLKISQTVPKLNCIEDPIELISFTNEEFFEDDVNFCLLHKKYPLLHFGDSSDMFAKLNRTNNFSQYYKRHWLPILGLEAAVESASVTSIILSRNTTVKIPINVNTEKKASIILDKEFGVKRHLVRVYDDKIICDSFICMRGCFCRCYGDICTCQNKRIWIGHGRVVSCSFTDNESKVKLDVKLMKTNYESENRNGTEFRKFTVEFILYTLPARRKEYAVRSVTNNLDNLKLYEKIALTRDITTEAPNNGGSNEILEQSLRSYNNPDLSGSNHITLNVTQSQAIREAHRKPFSLIQGPPGTGKTVTGAFLVHSFAMCSKNHQTESGIKKQILYCGPSNAAVDVATEKFLKLQERPDLHKFYVVRVYSSALEQQIFPEPREDLDSYDPRQKGYQISVGTRCSSRALHNLIREESNPYSKEIKEFDKKFAERNYNPGDISEADVKAYSDLKAKAEKVEVEKCDVIFATTICSACFRIRKWTKMEQIIIDESGMCTEAESLVPLSSHCDVTRVVLIGDHKQLRPIILCQEAKRLGLDISLFERYAELTKRDITMLVTQYRMHSTICNFPSKEFYEGRLKTEHTPVFDYQEPTSLRLVSRLGLIWPSEYHRVVFVDVFGHEESQALATNDGNVLSKKNYNESKEVVRVYEHIYDKLLQYYETNRPTHLNGSATTLEQAAADSIAVISPYQLQCATIRRALRKQIHRRNNNANQVEEEPKEDPENSKECSKPENSQKKPSLQFNVRTVVSSQGAEWDYVILTTVRSIPACGSRDQNNGEKTSLSLGCIGNPNQINVALTRARHGLIIIGPFVGPVDSNQSCSEI